MIALATEFPTPGISLNSSTDESFILSMVGNWSINGLAILSLTPDISVKSVNGDIMMSAIDKKNDTANTYDVKVGVCDTNKKFEFHFKTEHFKMLPGDYNLYISSKLISNFRHKNKTVQYWIALENTSKYEG